MANKIKLPYKGQTGWGAALNAFLMQTTGTLNSLTQKVSNLGKEYVSGIYNGPGVMNTEILSFKVSVRGEDNSNVEVEPLYKAGVYFLGNEITNFKLDLQAKLFINGKDVIILNSDSGLNQDFLNSTVVLNTNIDLSNLSENNAEALFLYLEDGEASFKLKSAPDYKTALSTDIYCQVGIVYKKSDKNVYFKTKFSSSSKNSFIDLYQTFHSYSGTNLKLETSSPKISNEKLSYTSSGINAVNSSYLDVNKIDTVNFNYGDGNNIIYNYYKIIDGKVEVSTEAVAKSLIETDGNCFAAYLDVFGQINIVVDTNTVFTKYMDNSIQRLTFLTPEYAEMLGFTELYRGYCVVSDNDDDGEEDKQYFSFAALNNRISSNETTNTITAGNYFSGQLAVLAEGTAPGAVNTTDKVKIEYKNNDINNTAARTVYFNDVKDGSNILLNNINNETINIGESELNYTDSTLNIGSDNKINFTGSLTEINFNEKTIQTNGILKLDTSNTTINWLSDLTINGLGATTPTLNFDNINIYFTSKMEKENSDELNDKDLLNKAEVLNTINSEIKDIFSVYPYSVTFLTETLPTSATTNISKITVVKNTVNIEFDIEFSSPEDLNSRNIELCTIPHNLRPSSNKIGVGMLYSKYKIDGLSICQQVPAKMLLSSGTIYIYAEPLSVITYSNYPIDGMDLCPSVKTANSTNVKHFTGTLVYDID